MKKVLVAVGVGLVSFSILAFAHGCMNVQAKLQEAYKAASENNFPMAVEITNKILKKEKGNVTAMILNGICLNAMGRSEESVAMLGRAAELAPDDFYAQYYAGAAFEQCGRYSDALAPLRKADGLRPRNPAVMILLARCAIELNLDDGVRYLQMLRVVPGMEARPELHNDLGYLLVNKGQYEAAKSSFARAWSLDQGSFTIPGNLAVMYDQYLHDSKEALRHYRACHTNAMLAGNQPRANQVRDRIVQLEKEAPRAGTAVPPAGVQPKGTTGAKGAAVTGGKTAAGKTSTAKSGTKKATSSTKPRR